MSARCRSCGRDIEWAVAKASGARLPIDPGAVTDRDPVPSDVVLHVASRKAAFVSATALSNGDVERWLGAKGTELRTSHWETCPGAAQHRAGFQRKGQERMEI